MCPLNKCILKPQLRVLQNATVVRNKVFKEMVELNEVIRMDISQCDYKKKLRHKRRHQGYMHSKGMPSEEGGHLAAKGRGLSVKQPSSWTCSL